MQELSCKLAHSKANKHIQLILTKRHNIVVAPKGEHPHWTWKVEDAAKLSRADRDEDLCRVGETTALLENDTEAAEIMPEEEPGSGNQTAIPLKCIHIPTAMPL
eukprot:5328853-Amphidinium_carterae.1